MIGVAISNMMTTLGSFYPEINYLNKAADNIIEVQDETPLKFKTEIPNLTNGDIHFDNVHFSYNDEVEVLHNINFEAKPKTTTALIGSIW
ncbi:hypothetical protein [endosymbiont 'TC1' of Trimyema compressum]|uniref:hypothetical protein n=1 Tax=endosymbiont 'TC1' of Trimyema compressum TaxID=243899 RepID=UPI001FE13894|nr:hypothetical protein [endosymbiont 'TC1' of Trimyema compressum]